jgi:serine/threonine protein kinase
MTEGQSAPETSGNVYPLGRYIVLAELGRGGMAEVYLALARGPNGFNKLVVLKLLRTHLAEDNDFLRMFLDEARLAARLNHANIVQTYEVGVEGGRNCIVMEYLEGRTYAEVESSSKPDPIALSLGVRVLADTLAALHHAHELCDVDGRPLGLVHRDVSPHNILVTYDGQVKLLDFGIAKAADDGAKTKTGVFKGKLRYTAPERFAGEDSDRRSDVFSVGVMLWQLLTRRRLWSGLNELAVMQHLASRAPIASPRSVNPDVPILLDEICMKALAPSPIDRFETAAQMQDALEEFLAGESVGTTNRALAKFMGDVFGETRQRFQRTVDEQIRAAANVPLDFEASGSIARLRTDGIPQLGAPESMSSIPMPTSSSRVRPGMGMMGMGPTSRPPGLASSVIPSEAPGPRRSWGVALTALFAMASILIVVFLRADRTPAPTPAEGPAAGAQLAGSPGVALVTGAVAAPPAPVSSASPGPETVSLIDAAVVKRAAQPASAAAPARQAPRTHAAPAPAETHSAPPPVLKVEPPKREVDCSSPYFLDDQGMKKIRPECL